MKKKFEQFQKEDFHRLGRSLEISMSIGDIMFIPMKIKNMADAEIEGVVKKMNQEYLPSDIEESQYRGLVRMACMNAF